MILIYLPQGKKGGKGRKGLEDDGDVIMEEEELLVEEEEIKEVIIY